MSNSLIFSALIKTQEKSRKHLSLFYTDCIFVAIGIDRLTKNVVVVVIVVVVAITGTMLWVYVFLL